MQLKTIKKVLVTKLEDWLESITDRDLRKDIKDNLLVSGGSITSMLQNLPVNDYDIYIKDVNVLIRLAKYYCSCKILDGRKRNEYIKKEYPDYNEKDPFWMETDEKYAPEQLCRLLSLKEDQVKLDIQSIGERFDLKLDAGGAPLRYQVSFLSQNAISLTDDIQIVLRFHGDAEQIHKTFDFIHATNYFTFEEGLVTNKAALESILTKCLKYQGSFYPLTSIIRLKKFIHRGWTINAGEMLKMMFQVSELDLKDIYVLEEQLIGVDVAYFAVLIEILRNTKTDKLDSHYINTIIDRVFNEYDEPENQEPV